VAVAEPAFAGVFDPDRGLAPARRAELDEPGDATCPRRDFVHVGRLWGYYGLKYYRRCDHLIANNRAIVDYAAAAAWPQDRIDHLPDFVPDPQGERRGDDVRHARIAS
jgi:hypothetical protein